MPALELQEFSNKIENFLKSDHRHSCISTSEEI